MANIVSLHAIDQGLVNQLCDIIRALNNALQHEAPLELTEKQVDMYNRITEGS